MKFIILKCPHCEAYMMIEEFNCNIFRHGFHKETNTQIDPHSSKELCDYYTHNKLIYGCGKPFKPMINENGKCYAVKYDYI
jgi:hypothetical protein